MNVERFQQELAELVKRHGGQLVTPVEIKHAGDPYEERYVHPVPEMRGLHMFNAIREVQPIRIKVSIDTVAMGDWRYSSNHPSKHSSNELGYVI